MSLKISKDISREVFETVRAMGKERLLVGIPSDKSARKEADGKAPTITNAAIGYINERGDPARNIPARPHLVPGIEKNRKELTNILGKYASAAFDKKEMLTKGLNAAGLKSVADIKNIIRTQEGFDPLSESTIKTRERRKPTPFYGTSALEVTGQYINSITYVIESKYRKG